MENKEFISIVVAILVFILNVIYQRSVKRDAARERLKNELISISDRLIRILFASEQSYALSKFHLNSLRFISDEREYKLAEQRALFYLKMANDNITNYASTKSELVRVIRDLSEYWNDESSKKKLFKVLENILFINGSRKGEELKNETNLADLRSKLDAILAYIPFNVFADGIGIQVAYLQRLVDPTFPIHYTNIAEHKALIVDKLRAFEAEISTL